MIARDAERFFAALIVGHGQPKQKRIQVVDGGENDVPGSVFNRRARLVGDHGRIEIGGRTVIGKSASNFRCERSVIDETYCR